MADCDAILTNGLLSEEQFVRYKTYCEGKRGQSLERELQALHLPLLPQVLQTWKILNTAWNDYEGFIKGDLSGYLYPDGQISMDDLPLIISSVGIYWPKATVRRPGRTCCLVDLMLISPVVVIFSTADRVPQTQCNG